MVIIDGVEMVDVHEAARLTRRTPETVRRWVWSGRIEAVKRGNKLFLPRAAMTGVGDDGEAHTAMPLAEWAALLPTSRRGRAGRSARDLVAEDRERRARR